MKKLPRSLTRVTAFSKMLALLLILAFLGVAFYAGMLFSQKYMTVLSSVTPTPTSIQPSLTGVQPGGLKY